MMDALQTHWNAAYARWDEPALPWFEPVPDLSIELVRRHVPATGAAIDIGGGASRMVDALLDVGFAPVSVLDLSATALAVSQERLGARAGAVRWICQDVTRWTPTQGHVLWHDRAAFHFLTDADARRAYVKRLDQALAPDGVAIIAGFALDGPEKCSNLPVLRYAPETLLAEINTYAPTAFRLLDTRAHVHVTPGGTRQSYQVSVLGRAPGPQATS
ncbi:class I SAM-dependent methyltransferase [Mesobacterium sp. TK19101]|uniref:Class I SAM-dependent methyltransferase n=1 Tax=Mesobacterium hydrothermale TaxID=3111907 RepID=A0ABU6HG75_9RHOB|nr:class I SAM-dependent methyltransferase [Mesobacterium sp. TK19101]MEC3860468.1 class I SAM-dependent methyltransferase [Mesobacterium sp. TK19101]